MSAPHRDVAYIRLPISNATEYTIENIAFIPAKIAMACDDVLNNGENMVVPNTNLIAILNFDFPMDSTKLLELNEKGHVIVENYSSNVIVTVIQQSDGLYSLKLSLEELNAVAATRYCFKGGYEHTWVITDEGWFNG